MLPAGSTNPADSVKKYKAILSFIGLPSSALNPGMSGFQCAALEMRRF
jgi:hypothetical protein